MCIILSKVGQKKNSEQQSGHYTQLTMVFMKLSTLISFTQILSPSDFTCLNENVDILREIASSEIHGCLLSDTLHSSAVGHLKENSMYWYS